MSEIFECSDIKNNLNDSLPIDLPMEEIDENISKIMSSYIGCECKTVDEVKYDLKHSLFDKWDRPSEKVDGYW